MQTLKRELSPLGVWALAFGCIIGGSAFFMPGNTFLPKAGPLGTAIAMFAASILMIVIAINYHYMVNRFPVAGGEFAFAKNAFNKYHAFFCAWFLGLSYISLVPLNATLLGVVGRNVFGDMMVSNVLYSVAGFDVYLFDIVLSVFTIVLLSWLNVRGVKTAGVFNTLLAFALLLGVVIFCVAAIFSSHASFSHMSPAFPSGDDAWLGFVGILAVSPWAFVGFDTIPQTAEEFSFSHAKTRRLLIFAILFAAIVYVAINTVTASVVPAGYENWESYVADIRNLKGLKSLPTFNAAHALLGKYGLMLFCGAIIATCFASVIGFSIASSRLLYSMSSEGALPAWFGRLHPKYSTPANATMFVMMLSLVAPFFGRTVLLWVVDMSAIGAAVGFFYTSSAALKYASQERRPMIICTGVVGLLASLFFVILLLCPIRMFGCSLCAEEYVSLAVWIVMGLVFFLIRNKTTSSH